MSTTAVNASVHCIAYVFPLTVKIGCRYLVSGDFYTQIITIGPMENTSDSYIGCPTDNLIQGEKTLKMWNNVGIVSKKTQKLGVTDSDANKVTPGKVRNVGCSPGVTLLASLPLVSKLFCFGNDSYIVPHFQCFFPLFLFVFVVSSKQGLVPW